MSLLSRRLGLLAMSGLIVLFVACGKPQNGGGGAASQEVGAPKPARTDEQISADVKKVFATDPELAKEKIEITVKDGRVILVGEVTSGEVRIKAEDKARAVPEVFGVDAEKLLAK